MKETNAKGFTIIELIVVMAIIGILVLLAAPKFLGYTQKANEVKISYDARVIEAGFEEYRLQHPDVLNTEWMVEDTEVLLIAEENRLYSREGAVPMEQLQESNYYLLPSAFIEANLDMKLKLDGKVYYQENGDLYLESEKSYSSKGNDPEVTDSTPDPIISNIPATVNSSSYGNLTSLRPLDNFSTESIDGEYYWTILRDINILEYSKAVYLDGVLVGYFVQKITLGSYSFGYESNASATFITVDNNVHDLPMSMTNKGVWTRNNVNNGDGTYLLNLYSDSLSFRASIPIDTNKSIAPSP